MDETKKQPPALKRTQIDDFLETREAIAIFSPGPKSYAGLVRKIDIDLKADSEIVSRVSITFFWFVEVNGYLYSHPRKGEKVTEGPQLIKSFVLPCFYPSRAWSGESYGGAKRLQCCCGENHDQFFQLSNRIIDIFSIKKIGRGCKMKMEF